MNRLLCIVVFLIFNFVGFSQDANKIIDSLKQVLSNHPSDSLKIKAYGDLCWYYRNVSIDSAFHYGNLALQYSKNTGNKQGESQAYNDLGILYYDISNFKKSISYYKKAMSFRENHQDSMGMASIHNKLGIAYQRIFKMDSAIYYATNALKIYEAKKHTKYAAIIKNNIANIYQDLKQYQKALDTHLEVSEIYSKLNDFEGLTYSYTNIGNAYLYLGDTLQTLNYYNKGIEIAESQNLLRELSTLYNNLGSVFKGQKKYVEAIENYNKSLSLRTKLNDDYGVSSAAINIGSLHMSKGEFNLAEERLRYGLELAKKVQAKELEMNAYGSFLSYYAYKKNTDSVIRYQNLYNAIQDTIFNERITKEVLEVREKYDAAEREKEIQSQRADLAIKELNINQKNTQIIGLVILILVLSLLGYLLYKQQKLKNQQLQKESELKEALVKIETQNKLQEQRLTISRDLHDNIGAQLTFIISSIDNLQYGFKITNDKLNKKLAGISEFTKETIYELRDTIWAMNKSEISLEDLQGRISNFIDKAGVSSNAVSFSFEVDNEVPKDFNFSSVKGMNIYRIIQEAINNAVKYSQADEIKVRIQKLSDGLGVFVHDNGKGFDGDIVEKGNGIDNMKKRAEEIGAHFSIESHLGKGTSVVLQIKSNS
ncbi:sensor histidine kinase [Flavobacteriaceae bacterium XHP0103]|uniref:tetratricopeptide repeat-containing sensor histidine kinase n=1 Tax=Marixanthotalea marina TaxID=2844359 RepID=UPI002989D343|nr:sensor histidine kinase [Marixanthotalea marina]MBU3821789.1 sensor histidine kinase [Marixanthotalea marina]